MESHMPIARPRMPRTSRRRHANGVGLIEVLVAVTILAFGLLGIAAMQATTLRNSQSASARSEATVATYAILERMRANYAVAANGGYDLAAMTCTPPTPTDLVTRDQHDWIESMQASMGDSACGQIEKCGGDKCTITIRWNDSRGSGKAADLEELKMVTETRL
jgi:type IV pilus assembly protein PilV